MAEVKARVLQPGVMASVQDGGRPGWRASGVSVGGAMDAFGAAVANVLAGNDPASALIEITWGGFRLACEDDRVAAWCGGHFEVRMDGSEIPAGRPFVLKAGAVIEFTRPRMGCRAWLALNGGISVPEVLGSRATDLRAGFGGCDGRALRSGDDLPLGEANVWRPFAEPVALFGAPHHWAQPAGSEPVLRVIAGPEWDRFSAGAQARFLDEVFEVSPAADRMGARLEGFSLERCDGGAELVSSPVAPGTIQVPSNGQPILLLADCQTTGGYPRIANVISVDLPTAAQLRPGDRVRFREVTLAEAHSLMLERSAAFQRFTLGLRLRTP